MCLCQVGYCVLARISFCFFFVSFPIFELRFGLVPAVSSLLLLFSYLKSDLPNRLFSLVSEVLWWWCHSSQVLAPKKTTRFAEKLRIHTRTQTRAHCDLRCALVFTFDTPQKWPIRQLWFFIYQTCCSPPHSQSICQCPQTHCTLHTLHTAHCTLHTLHSAHCTWHTAHCTHCTLLHTLTRRPPTSDIAGDDVEISPVLAGDIDASR
jgi:hypothetical protein